MNEKDKNMHISNNTAHKPGGECSYLPVGEASAGDLTADWLEKTV